MHHQSGYLKFLFESLKFHFDLFFKNNNFLRTLSRSECCKYWPDVRKFSYFFFSDSNPEATKIPPTNWHKSWLSSFERCNLVENYYLLCLYLLPHYHKPPIYYTCQNEISSIVSCCFAFYNQASWQNTVKPVLPTLYY